MYVGEKKTNIYSILLVFVLGKIVVLVLLLEKVMVQIFSFMLDRLTNLI